MGWERRGSGRYCYESRRAGGRVVKRYVGTGPVAAAVAELNALGREQQGWDRGGRDPGEARRRAGGKRLARFLEAGGRVARRGLAGESPNAVEVLLAERAAVRWLAVSVYEYAHFGRMTKITGYREHEFHERRIGAANRRFLSALRALAAVRRMRFPDMLAIVNVEAGTRLAGARVGG